MSPESVAPEKAKKLIEQGALLLDIRDTSEYLREHISGARSFTLTDIQAGKKIETQEGRPVIFYCLSGGRTAQNSNVLIAAAGPVPALILAGGINAWKSARLPVIEDKKQPLPVMRQVQIAAGILILTGVVLGYSIDSRLFLLSGFIGAGLLFAGVSGVCGMANFLLKMPWNRANK
ncbi:rhodanese family protein [Pantoea vagans]|uniref:rhodanese family protein n=1 Tax=Pantoea vagans TaxID=470934 RepID=UPI000D78805A|nr:rhodanese family protein [Pantoea vagans]AWP35283.1 hypothetical protein B9D02_22225 [Pantoea vagans]